MRELHASMEEIRPKDMRIRCSRTNRCSTFMIIYECNGNYSMVWVGLGMLFLSIARLCPPA